MERALAAILSTLEENHNEMKSSMREVMRAVRRTQREVGEMREDVDLILGTMYKPSCKEVAQELHASSRSRTQVPSVGVYTIKPPKGKPTQVCGSTIAALDALFFGLFTHFKRVLQGFVVKLNDNQQKRNTAGTSYTVSLQGVALWVILRNLNWNLM